MMEQLRKDFWYLLFARVSESGKIGLLDGGVNTETHPLSLPLL